MVKNLNLKNIIILAVILVLALWLFGNKKENWTLMVCDEKLNDAECYSNSYVISGFASAKECLLEGATRFKKEGFECGKNCRDDNGIKICKEVCNSAGCRE